MTKQACCPDQQRPRLGPRLRPCEPTWRTLREGTGRLEPPELSAQSRVAGSELVSGVFRRASALGGGRGCFAVTRGVFERTGPVLETRFASGGRIFSLQGRRPLTWTSVSGPSGALTAERSPLASLQPGLQNNGNLGAGPGPGLLFWHVPWSRWSSCVWKSSGGLHLKSQPQAGGDNSCFRGTGASLRELPGCSPSAPLSASILCSTRVCSEDETPRNWTWGSLGTWAA